MKRGVLHENLARKDTIALPSDRRFGVTMAAILGVIFVLLGAISGRWHAWLAITAAALLAAGVLLPRVLHPLNRLWLRLGIALHSVVNPLVLAALFFFITLIGVAWRCVNRDPLRLKFDAAAESYWVERQPPGPNPDHFPYQF